MITLNNSIFETLEQGGTLVVPTRQRAHALRLAFARAMLARGRTVWPTPDVLAADAWISREVERSAARDASLPRVLSPAEDWWLWRECTLQATRDSDIVAGAALAEALRRADRLATEHRIDISRWRALGGRETELLDTVRRAVQRARIEVGADTAHHIAAGLARIGGARAVHFAGFAGLEAPALRAIHDRRRAQGDGGEWWTVAEPACLPRVDRAGDTGDELERAAGWCLRQLERSGDARLLIVAAGDAESRERLATQVRAALAPAASFAGEASEECVAIDGGAPLVRQPLVQYLLGGLDWIVDGLEFEAFSDWLRSPYGALGGDAAARLDLWWRRDAPLEADARASLPRLARAAREGLEPARVLIGGIESALTALGNGAATARGWSERFRDVVTGLRGTVELTSAEQQTWLRFIALLDEFGGVAGVAGLLDARRALRALHELASRTSYQPATGDALVTIVPGHDDPIAGYDAIRVLRLTADAWPAPALADPFIPLPALREAGVAAASGAGQLERARLSLAAWRAATCDLTLSSPTAAGDVELAPSPLLAAWPAIDAAEPALPWLARRLHRPVTLAMLDDPRGQAWPAHRPLPRGTRSLQLQSECPFRAHAELQLGAEPLEAPAPGVARDERGRWLHRALELFWRGLGDSAQLAALDGAAVQRLARTAVAAARDDTFPPGPDIAVAAREREARRLADLVARFAERERERPAFVVRGLEVTRTLDLGEAQLMLRLDRVDALEAGGFAVLDYKSGEPKSLQWYGGRPAPAQLMAYLAALGDEVRVLVNAHLTQRLAWRKPAYYGVAEEGDLLPGVRAMAPPPDGAAGSAWAYWVGRWHGELTQLAGAFLRGDAAVLPAKGACRHCHLATLCRVGERAQADGGDAPPEEAGDD